MDSSDPYSFRCPNVLEKSLNSLCIPKSGGRVRKNVVLTRKIVCLLLGCAAMATSSSVYAFAVWQNSLRDKMNLTESQSNLVGSFGNIGMGMGLPAGIMTEKLGYRISALAAAVLSAAGYTTMWGVIDPWNTIFNGSAVFVSFLFLIIGFGGANGYMGALMSNVPNWPEKHRGKVIGLLDASLSTGPAILSALYAAAFRNGHVDSGDEGNQNLEGYFLVLAIGSAIIYSLGVVLLYRDDIVSPTMDPDETSYLINSNDDYTDGESTRNVAPEHSVNSSNNLNPAAARRPRSRSKRPVEYVVLHESSVIPANDFVEYPLLDTPCIAAFKRSAFVFLLIQAALASSVQLVYQNNITTFLLSFELTEYTTTMTILGPLVQTLSKIVAGFLSDHIAPYAPRSLLFLPFYFGQTAILVVSIWFGDRPWLVVTGVVVVGLANGITWCQTPIILSEFYGTKYLGRNWGMTMVISGLVGLAASTGFGKIYDAYTPSYSLYCTGLSCFTWSFVLLSGMSVAALISSIGLVENQYKFRKQRRKAADASRHDESINNNN